MAKPKYKVTGIAKVERNLISAINRMTHNNDKGIEAAAVFVKGQSQKLTSIKEGNLIRTAFNKSIGTLKEPAQAVGYTADYAAAVHEMPDDTKWNRPGAENEFLSKSVVNNLTKILNIIIRFSSRKPT